MLAHGIARGAGIGKPRRNNAPYPDRPSDATPPRGLAVSLRSLFGRDASAGVSRRLFRPRTRATRPCRHVRSRCSETTEPRGVCGRARTVAWRASCAPRNDYRSASSGWSSSLDHWRSRRNREYRTPRVGRSHFGGGGSGSRSAVPTYPQPPHKWTTSPDSGRTGGSLRASRIASPHWGHRGAVSGSFRTSMLGNQCGEHFRPRRSTGQYCSLTCRKASARFRTVSVPQLRNGASTTSPIIDSHSR